jgi:hypothetical protein
MGTNILHLLRFREMQQSSYIRKTILITSKDISPLPVSQKCDEIVFQLQISGNSRDCWNFWTFSIV